MSVYMWRGRTTGARYDFDRNMIPAALIDAQGNLLDGVTYNGEIVVKANEDGSVARPQRTGPPPGGDPYASYVASATWDRFKG